MTKSFLGDDAAVLAPSSRYAIDATPARWRGDAGSYTAQRSQQGNVIAEK